MGFFRVIGGLLLALLLVGVGAAIYQTGVGVGTAGAAGAAGVAGGTAPVVVGPAYGYGWGWGFGGGLFHILGFIFFLVIFFAILRAIFGGHRRGWGGGWGRGWGPGGYGDHPGQQFGPWEDRARQAHDEWHRRQDAPGATGPSTPTGQAGPTTPSGDPGSGSGPTGGNPA